ncbi:hypothetical protein GCM10023214_00530 [Amycolatopsis dongchuanensis]|uniref:Uncharacterized protein n=1 Tax=Amycolatopsis dongchuanensis TaxID=1070866 RepID=A0ABP9PR53_9PSEU
MDAGYNGSALFVGVAPAAPPWMIDPFVRTTHERGQTAIVADMLLRVSAQGKSQRHHSGALTPVRQPFVRTAIEHGKRPPSTSEEHPGQAANPGVPAGRDLFRFNV